MSTTRTVFDGYLDAAREIKSLRTERDRLLDLLTEAEPFITSATAAPPELRTRVVHALIGPPIGRETE